MKARIVAAKPNVIILQLVLRDSKNFTITIVVVKLSR